MRPAQALFDKAMAKKGGPPPLIEVYFSDYQESDGIKHWRKAEQFRNGQKGPELRVRTVRFLDKIDESLFGPPE